MKMTETWAESRLSISVKFWVSGLEVTHLVQVAELRPGFRVQDLHLEKNIIFDIFRFSSFQAVLTSGFNKLCDGE